MIRYIVANGIESHDKPQAFVEEGQWVFDLPSIDGTRLLLVLDEEIREFMKDALEKEAVYVDLDEVKV